ncbi:unnamed protein product [Triticum turgidum subsp. durum]|uniref:CUE domain-containing protein n=1 Tax=Triticum turgidum subsp. durum TaxID=4567 RepID=A0A9R1QYA8_TRITD|nr:unnamed protein product [Triticum turgidum subsp. durum]
MAVEVDGTRKHGAVAFLDDPFDVLQAKRGRCSPSATAASVADLGINMEFDPVEAVQSVFPGADPQLLRGYLEGSGNVLDAAIRSFRDYLASDSATTNAGASSSGVASDVHVMNTPANRTEWAKLIVKKMSSASDPNDARNRVFRILEMFDKCAANCSTPDEAHKMREMKGTTDGAGGKVSSGGDKRGKE